MLPRIAATIVVAAACASLAPAQTPDFYDINAYRTIYLNFAQTNWWTLLEQNYGPEINIPATMIVDGITLPNVGVRFRGNTSYTMLPAGSQKKSFNIETDAYVPGQDIYGYDHINLNNGFHDPTFLREFLSYMVMRWFGPAPGCNLVKLYLNNQYWGVYINVQQPNKDMAQRWWRSNDGNRYRGFPTSGTFANGRCAMTWLGTTLSQYLSAYQAKQGDGVDLMTLCDILNNTPSTQIENALPVIFSVDQFYRYAACMNVLTNTDSYLESGKDHFLYHDNVYGAFHVFPFDMNESLAGSSTLSPWSQTTNTFRPAFTKTFVVNAWRERYRAHLRTISEDAMNWAVLGPIATQFHTMIAADVAADTKKVYTTAQFTTNLTASVTVSGGGPFPGTTTIPGLQALIQARRNYLTTHVDLTGARATLTQLQHSPANPTPVQPVTITVQVSNQAVAVDLWRRSAGPFAKTPMFDDGQHGDGSAGDGLWGAILPASAPGTLMDYYVSAATSLGTLSFAPKTAEFQAPWFRVSWPTGTSPIRINEVLAQNNALNTDPAGEHEDWVELYNDSAAPVAIGGMHLTDSLLNPTKFMIPAGQTIPAYGTVLVWCDEDGTQGPLHANFKLSAGGEAVALFASDGVTQLDAFEFGAQVADISIGRLRDGGAPWVSFPSPTPAARNELAGCGTRRYSALTSSAHLIRLGLSGSTSINATAVLGATFGPANGSGLLALGALPAYDAIPGTTVIALCDLASAVMSAVAFDASGAWTLGVPIPNDPSIIGARVYVQTAGLSTGLTVSASNALEVVICP